MKTLQRDEFGNLIAAPELNSLAAAILGAVNASDAWLGLAQLEHAAEAVLRFPVTERDIREVCDALWSEGSIAIVMEGNASGEPSALVVGKTGEQNGRHALPQHCDGLVVRREGEKWRACIMNNGSRRTWSAEAELHFAATPGDAVAMIYHANEVEYVIDRGSYAVAVIDNGSGDNPDAEAASDRPTPDLATLAAVVELLPDAFGDNIGGPIHHLINVLLGVESDTSRSGFECDTADALFNLLTERLPDLACPIDDQPADAVRPQLTSLQRAAASAYSSATLLVCDDPPAMAGPAVRQPIQGDDWQRAEAERQGRDLFAIRGAVQRIANRIERM